jgi:hypothetical protein
MKKFELEKLNQIVSQDKTSDEIIIELKKQIDLFKNKVQFIDWQLLASYLDSKIFEFIIANQNDQKITNFGQELSQDLADKFNVQRDMANTQSTQH